MSLDADDLAARARAAIASDRVTAPTRRVLQARLDHAPAEAPLALDLGQMRTLRAAAKRLVPMPGLDGLLDLAGRFDAELAQGPGDGWRYADLPPDRQAQAQGLALLDACAHAAHGRAFAELDATAQDALLAAAQAGDPPGAPWPFPSDRWFEDLLAGLVRLAYGHPAVQVAIGYDGFADAHGQPPAA